jgi:hypothetical protein
VHLMCAIAARLYRHRVVRPVRAENTYGSEPTPPGYCLGIDP